MNRLELIFLTAMNFDLGVGDDAAICKRITRMLTPPKISHEILICDRISQVVGCRHWSPDTAVNSEFWDDNYQSDESDEYNENDDEI